MCRVILRGTITDILEFIHPLRQLFQLVTYNNLFIPLPIFPALFEASSFLFINGIENVSQYGQFVLPVEVNITLVFVTQNFQRFFPDAIFWSVIQEWISQIRPGSECQKEK